MKFAHKVAHLFWPQESNNHKAKLLHSSSLTYLTLTLILFQGILGFLPKIGPRILGYAANISPDEVIRLTNEKRVQNGLSPLTLNTTLAQAAQAKGADMLNRDYWAHVAPDGTQPWKFFIDFGYRYRYAGENLARDFKDAPSTVEAWMASSSHRENLLSPKYKDIGIAVVEGDLAGVDTTIVVQFFGTKYTDTLPPAPIAQATPTPTSVVTPTVVPTVTPAISVPTPAGETVLTQAPSQPILISPFNTTKTVSVMIVALLLAVLIIDGVVTSRRRIARIAGRTFAHLSFLGMILAIILILKAGQVL
jgi:hypothetical protein